MDGFRSIIELIFFDLVRLQAVRGRAPAERRMASSRRRSPSSTRMAETSPASPMTVTMPYRSGERTNGRG